MAPTPLKILVFASEYFIALDIQRALSEMPESDVEIVQTHDIASVLITRPFDLAVIGLSSDMLENAQTVATVEQHGGAVIFTSGSSHDANAFAKNGRWPVVEIPFVDEAFHYAASRALTLRAQSQG